MQSKDLLVIGGIVLAVMYFTGNLNLGTQSGTGTGTGTGTGGGGNYPDIGGLIDGTLTFTAYRDMVTGTAITSEYATVLEDGKKVEKSTNSGTLDTSVGDDLLIYFGLNKTQVSQSPTYYPDIYGSFVYPQKENEDVTGALCTISTATITSFDEYDSPQSSTTNAQAMTTNEKKDIKVRIKTSSQECYGAPDATKGNTICFIYSTTPFISVKATGKSAISAPYNVSSTQASAGNAIACYPFQTLKGTGVVAQQQVDIPVTLESSGTEPTTAYNITVWIDDISFDLNADTNALIEGFEDEDNNPLGANAISGKIYIS